MAKRTSSDCCPYCGSDNIEPDEFDLSYVCWHCGEEWDTRAPE